MIPKIRDFLLCLLLLALLIGCVGAEWWLTHRAGKLDTILNNLNSATYNASDVTWQADLAVSDARPILHKTLLHADQAAGETSRTMQHVATATQNIDLYQGAIAVATTNVLKQTSGTIATLNDQIGTVGEQARFTLSELESGGKSLRYTIDDFDKNVVNNPALGESFKNFALVTASFNDLIISSNHFMQSSDRVVQRFVPKPYTGKHRVLHGVGSAAWGTVNLGVPVGDLYRSVRGYPH